MSYGTIDHSLNITLPPVPIRKEETEEIENELISVKITCDEIEWEILCLEINLAGGLKLLLPSLASLPLSKYKEIKENKDLSNSEKLYALYRFVNFENLLPLEHIEKRINMGSLAALLEMYALLD